MYITLYTANSTEYTMNSKAIAINRKGEWGQNLPTRFEIEDTGKAKFKGSKTHPCKRNSENTVQCSTVENVQSTEEGLLIGTVHSNNDWTLVGSVENGLKRLKISEGGDGLNQACMIGDFATHSGTTDINKSLKIDFTQTQIGQVGKESEGGPRAESGLVCSVNPEKKSSDPNNRRRTQLKSSDLLIKHTQCTTRSII